jgi:hypothetical protein
MGFAERARTLRIEWERPMASIATGLNYDRKDLKVTSAMRDLCPLMYGKSAAMIIDGDPRLEIDCAARLIAFWTHIGCSEEWQRQQIDCYDQAKGSARRISCAEGWRGYRPAQRLQHLLGF